MQVVPLEAGSKDFQHSPYEKGGVACLRFYHFSPGSAAFDLGLERTGGFKTVAFCEIDPFCQRVLAKHWPGVPCYDDVRTLTAERLAADGIAVDVICGGFPCQDISIAGKGAGIDGQQSGLWGEYARLVRELRPAFVIVENSSELLHRGMGRVVGDLAALGYDAEWHCVPASYIGSPHHRDRVWIIAEGSAIGRNLANPLQADALRTPDAGIAAFSYQGGPRLHEGRFAATWGNWPPEPSVDRVVDGLPASLDRENEAYGNAVVPQIPELIGRAILAADAERLAA